jgi:hypothetical protein
MDIKQSISQAVLVEIICLLEKVAGAVLCVSQKKHWHTAE